jgi:cell division control protein 6
MTPQEDIFETSMFDFEEDSHILIDDNVLSPDYIPPRLIGRDEQIKKIAYLTKPVFRNGSFINCLVFGHPGTGKTVVSKYVLKNLTHKIEQDKELLRKLRRKSDNLLSKDELDTLNKLNSTPDVNLVGAYIQCKETYTTSGILHSLISQLDPDYCIPRKGISIDQYYNALYSIMRAGNIALVVILDEIDFLTSDSILYNFSRAKANGKLEGNQFISVLGLSNSIKYESKLDARIKSSIGFDKIDFPNYTTDDVHKILSDRVDLAFTPNSIEDETVIQCAKYVGQGEGDVRKAIKILKTAANDAEKECSSIVTLGHIETAMRKVQESEVMERVLSLSLGHQLVLLSIVKIKTYKPAATTGQITKVFNMLCTKIGFNLKSRKFAGDAISVLETMGFIKTAEVNEGRKKGGGRTRMVTIPDADIDDVKDAIYTDSEIQSELYEYDPISENRGILF